MSVKPGTPIMQSNEVIAKRLEKENTMSLHEDVLFTPSITIEDGEMLHEHHYQAKHEGEDITVYLVSQKIDSIILLTSTTVYDGNVTSDHTIKLIRGKYGLNGHIEDSIKSKKSPEYIEFLTRTLVKYIELS